MPLVASIQAFTYTRNLNPFCISKASLIVVFSKAAVRAALSPRSANARSPSARRRLAFTKMLRKKRLS